MKENIERCKVLLHILDVSDNDILNNYETIHNELKKYGKNLNTKKEIIALNKIDLLDNSQIKKILKIIKNKTGINPIAFSNFSEKVRPPGPGTPLERCAANF